MDTSRRCSGGYRAGKRQKENGRGRGEVGRWRELLRGVWRSDRFRLDLTSTRWAMAAEPVRSHAFGFRLATWEATDFPGRGTHRGMERRSCAIGPVAEEDWP